MKFLNSIKNFFVKFHHRFVDGSIGTKISHFIMGVGNLCHKQIITHKEKNVNQALDLF